MSDVSIEQVHHDEGHAPTEHKNDNLKFAMWLFLASEVVIFATLIGVFVLFRESNPARITQVHEASGIWLVSLNTFLLLTSSWAMVMGLRAIQNGNRQGLVRWISLTALLGALFVCFQYVEYTTLSREGITLYSDAFGMRFYAPTAFHGAHVITGVIWALWVIFQGRRGRYDNGKWLGVEIFGLFWHFVDVVWIILFTVIYLL